LIKSDESVSCPEPPENILRENASPHVLLQDPLKYCNAGISDAAARREPGIRNPESRNPSSASFTSPAFCTFSLPHSGLDPGNILVLLFRFETVTLLGNRGTQTARYGTRCSFVPPHMVCFFDALRDTVKMTQKAPKGPPEGLLGPDAPSNPVKKQALTRN